MAFPTADSLVIASLDSPALAVIPGTAIPPCPLAEPIRCVKDRIELQPFAFRTGSIRLDPVFMADSIFP